MSTAKSGAKGWQPQAVIEKASVRPIYKVKHLKIAFMAGFASTGDAEAEWQKFATKRGMR